MSKYNKFDYILILKLVIGYFYAVFIFDVIKIEKNIVNLILGIIIFIVICSIVEKIINIFRSNSKKNTINNK
ncbi:hypothetical protein KQI18_08320 [Clostridioides mangenotii]|uniref:hypothetical protein n=1 Tax=Metaclostridioides mangenotii TaxID=1540 RepID=UPI001C0F8563|nr:hypothetical protein [Clostridioides mangenotii]MBU5307789.1 hypothetical protein [Clostridioides mangenotii]